MCLFGTVLRSRTTHNGVRALHLSAHTLRFPTPGSVSEHFEHLASGPSSALFFSLSTAIQAQDMEPILSRMNGRGLKSVGTFHSSPYPEVAVAVFTPDPNEGEIVAWRSDATGRGPAEVGRWQRPGANWKEDTRGQEVGSLEEATRGGWDNLWAPQAMDAVLSLGPRESVGTVLCLTDGTPLPILCALDEYPNATKLGLVSAGTPFLTGRPHTLFHNGKTFSSGSVGLALPAWPKTQVVYGLKPLDEQTTVASARGNLLLRFEGTNVNPTQTLIAALQRRDAERSAGLTKDEEFWLAISDPGVAAPRIVRILSGDPSRGALSLDTETPLVTGQTVQFMYRSAIGTRPEPLADTLRFAAVPRSDEVEVTVQEGKPECIAGFLAASEGGFIFAPPHVPSDIASVGGAVVTAAW